MDPVPCQSAPAADGIRDAPSALHFLAPLNALDTFIQDLQHCDHGGSQLRLLLKAVGGSIRADAVFVQSLAAPAVFEAAGKVLLTSDTCRQVLQALLADVPAGHSQMVHAHLGAPPVAGMPAPASAALVRLSKSRKTWVAALRFAPGQHFRLTDVKLMVLARRLLVTHSRQLQAAEKLKETLLGLIHCLTAAID